MASIRRQGNVYEIRECIPTARGPRQRALARFRDVLTPEVLDLAAARARRRLDRAALTTQARERGIPVAERGTPPEARRLLARLRHGDPVSPLLVGLLRTALDGLPSQPLPPHLADVADWVGEPEVERGRALRGLLRTASRVHRSRSAVRDRPVESFPRFSSRDHDAPGS